MHAATLALIFGAGFIIMTPAGPVSTICIRRALLHGVPAGLAAGAGDAAAVALYATVGVTCGAVITHLFAPFAAAWHIATTCVLLAVALLLWHSRPMLPASAVTGGADIVGGFAAALGLALANPADVVLFAALFSGLGIVVHTPLEQVLFALTVFAGGCTYWLGLALFLDRWRAGLTVRGLVWLNRSCSAMMVAGAAASLASLARA